MSLVYVFIGGGLGASLRYILGLAFPIPLFYVISSSLLANALGSALAGCAFAYIRMSPPSYLMQNFALIGLCGGLTTFSTYILELFLSFEQKSWRLFLMQIGFHHIFAFGFFFLFYKVCMNAWGSNDG